MSATPEKWFLLETGARPAAENMAVDEVLLAAARELGHPVLRFYGWSEAAATFGYFQKHAEVAAMTALRPLVRRPTGGGLVPHDRDWTYSLVFPPAHSWYALKATASYQRVHAWIQRSFAEAGISTNLSPVARKDAPGQCFAGHERFDLLWQSRKIAGAAQRRTRDGLLIQGSVQPPPRVITRDGWQKALCAAATAEWNAEWSPFEWAAAMERRSGELTVEKYSRREYNERR